MAFDGLSNLKGAFETLDSAADEAGCEAAIEDVEELGIESTALEGVTTPLLARVDCVGFDVVDPFCLRAGD